MSERLTLEELQHTLSTMNAFSNLDCPVCASARQKLEALIKKEQEKPVKEITEIAGHTVTVERSR